MQIVDGVRYSDQDVRDFGLTGGRTAPEGDRELTRTTVAVGFQAPAQDTADPAPLAAEDTEQETGPDTTGPDDAAAKPARRAR